MKAPLLTLLLALPLVSTACGDGSAPAQVLRLRLAPLEPRGERFETRPIGRVELPADPAAWSYEGTTASLLAGPPPALFLQGDGKKSVSIPGPIPAAGCDAVSVEIAATALGEISAGLIRSDGRVFRGDAVVFGRNAEPLPVRIGLNELAPPGEYDRLVLEIDGLGPQALYGAIELSRTPPGRWLLDPADVDPLQGHGSTQRRAHGLAAGRPLGTSVRVPRGALLRFASGRVRGNAPEELASARLVVRVEAEGRAPLVEELPLPETARTPWRAAELRLDAFAGVEARVRFELAGSASGELAVVLADPRVVVPGEDAPTVLLVSSDTHRADHVGVARDARAVSTPTLDALAARGVWFEDCYTSTNVTNPSHMALLTGVHPREHGVLDNVTPITERAETLAERFAGAGYSCLAALSVHHLAPEISGLGQGFQCVAAPSGERPAEETIAVLSEWIGEREGEPLFVWLHVFDAHTPYAPPQEFHDRSWPAGRDAFDPALPPLEVGDAVFPPQLKGLRDLEFPRALYRAEVDALDLQLAAILEHPRVRAGIVAVTADHGESLGEHGIYFSHAEVYPQSLHVPLILAWPGAPAGLRVAAPARQIDIGRTLLDLAGLAKVAFPGRSLLPLVEGRPPASEPRFAIAANQTSAAVTIDGWHLMISLRAYRSAYSAERRVLHCVELYDLNADPAAEVDLVEREPERARRMRALLVEWLTSPVGAALAGEARDDAELRRHLAGLGYADDEGGAPSSAELFDPDCTCKWCARFR